MGEPDNIWEERINDLSKYKVTKEVMSNAKESAIFLHCLPAFHDLKTKVAKEMCPKFNCNELEVTAGKSHKDLVKIPEGLTVEQVSNTEVLIKGISKEAVGEFAAKVRKLRKPEPYKGKGIRYKDEFIRRKEGKKASK